jgi:VIT1/CCC1 family predicted Fe2+/Mn2+ transporter
VELILDLAVAALAVAVVASLAILAWTLAVSGTRGIHGGRCRIARLRMLLTDAEARLARTGEHPDR